MIAYIVLTIIAMLLLLLRKSIFYNDKILKWLLISLVYTYLFVLCVFRSPSVATDYGMYYYFFKSPSSVLKSHYIEQGYIYINEISQHFNNFMLISVLECILIFIGVLLLFNAFDINLFTGTSFFILTYMYFYQFNVLRASIANGIVMIGLAFFLREVNKNKKIAYVVFILIVMFATNIHTTSVLALSFLIFVHVKVTDKVVFYSLIVFLFSNLVYNIFDVLDGVALWMFPMYVSKYGLSYGQVMSRASLIKLLVYVIVFVFLYIYSKNNDDYSYKTNIILTGALFNNMTYGSGAIFIRLGSFVNIFTVLFSCIFIDNILPKCKYSGVVKNILRTSLILYWVLLFLYRLYTNNSGVVPYSFGV